MAGVVSFHARHDCGGNVSWHIPDMGRERRPPGITAQSLIIGGYIDADHRTRSRWSDASRRVREARLSAKAHNSD